MTPPTTHLDRSRFGKWKLRRIWSVVQMMIWVGGVELLVLLVLTPKTGLYLFWHVIIPIVPVLFVLAPGVWRNICPLGSTSLLAWDLGLSKRRRLSDAAQGAFFLAGMGLLFTIAPLRHAVLNTSGVSTAGVLAGLGLVALAAGFLFERKSGWCAGLCPVYCVESLYGKRPAIRVINGHCEACYKCMLHCPETRSGTDPTSTGASRIHNWAGTIMTGGFVGFVWGWFQVPDFDGTSRWHVASVSYLMCLAGLSITLMLYVALRRALPMRWAPRLSRVFAAGAVSCFYWYAFPEMLGFGLNAETGIVNLSGVLPEWSVWIARVAPAGLFIWWLVVRNPGGGVWMDPPPPAPGAAVVTLGISI